MEIDVADGLLKGADGRTRCAWAGTSPDYIDYHDREWGRPVDDDVRLFEKICLEGFQSGLSWLTILRKRENFRRAFAHFDFTRVSRYGDTELARLLDDAGIVRHRGKIASAINNAGRVVDLVKAEGRWRGWCGATSRRRRPARRASTGTRCARWPRRRSRLRCRRT